MIKQSTSASVMALWRRVASGFVIFVTVLLFVNLLLNGIFFSSFWVSFGLAMAVLALGTVTVGYGLPRIQGMGWFVAASTLASVAAIVIVPTFFVGQIQQTLTYANFYFVRDPYLQKVVAAKRTGVPLFITFKWENSTAKSLLIYDESDELADPTRPKSKEWWQRAIESDMELATCYWSGLKVGEHFYRITFACEMPYSGSPIPKL